MGQPAAKQGDQITATDMHVIQPPGSTSPVLVPHPFLGIIDGSLSSDVKIMGMPAATVTSTAHEDDVTLELAKPNRPGVIRIGDDFVYVVMPVNLASGAAR